MANKKKKPNLDFKKIIEDYHLIKNQAEVARKHNITMHYLRLLLKENNVKSYPNSVTNKVNANLVIEAYLKSRKANLVAEEFNIAHSSVLKILHDNGVNVKVYPYTDQELIDAYLKYKSSGKAAKELNVTEGLILNAMRRNGIEALYANRVKEGDVFGMLTVIRHTHVKITPSGYQQKIFECKCECGNTVEVPSSTLTSTQKNKKDCGCVFAKIQEKWELKRIIKKEKEDKWKAVLAERELKKQKKQEEKDKKEQEKLSKLPKIGERNELLVILEVHPKEKKLTVQCDCGKTNIIKIINFKKTKSCGCFLSKISTTHGWCKKDDHIKRRWYDRWRSMIKRCYREKCHAYKNYGARGIRVCDRWLEPNGAGCENYYNDIHNILGPQPSLEHSLDRIDNNGMYEINNMRWATNSEQTKNQRRFLK